MARVLVTVGRRLLWAFPTLLAIVSLSFFLLRLAPGGPFDADRALPPQVEANLKAAYRLDQPLAVQFLHYLGQLAQGDLGPSLKYKDASVAELIAAALPVSAMLGGLALLTALAVGVWAGARAAHRPHGLVGRLLAPMSMLGLAVPSFVVAPLLALVLALWAGWLPVAGWGGGDVRHLLLPVLTLALPHAAIVARLTRGACEEVLALPHVRTARAKGLPAARILDRHVLPLALLPVLSFLGPAAAGLVAGSVVVETLFGLPGLGRYFAQAALNRDYTLVLGVVVLLGAALLLFNLLVDLAYTWLDPRIDAGRRHG